MPWTAYGGSWFMWINNISALESAKNPLSPLQESAADWKEKQYHTRKGPQGLTASNPKCFSLWLPVVQGKTLWLLFTKPLEVKLLLPQSNAQQLLWRWLPAQTFLLHEQSPFCKKELITLLLLEKTEQCLLCHDSLQLLFSFLSSLTENYRPHFTSIFSPFEDAFESNMSRARVTRCTPVWARGELAFPTATCHSCISLPCYLIPSLAALEQRCKLFSWWPSPCQVLL